MANPYRGEAELRINGQVYCLRLTLGALVELEQVLKSTGLVSLVERFENNAFSASDLLALLAAGLRGGGSDLSVEDLSKAEIEGGAMQAARVAARLLALSFAGPETGHGSDQELGQKSGAP